MEKDFDKIFGDIVTKGMMDMSDELRKRQDSGPLSPEELVAFSNGQMMGIVKNLLSQYHQALLEHLRSKGL